MPDNNTSRKRRFFVLESWEEGLRDTIKAIVEDTLVFLTVVSVLVLVDRYLQTVPYRPERKEILETLHFYTSGLVLVMFACDLLWQVVIFIIVKEINKWNQRNKQV